MVTIIISNIPETNIDESSGLDIPFDSSSLKDLSNGKKQFIKNGIKRILTAVEALDNKLDYSDADGREVFYVWLPNSTEDNPRYLTITITIKKSPEIDLDLKTDKENIDLKQLFIGSFKEDVIDYEEEEENNGEIKKPLIQNDSLNPKHTPKENEKTVDLDDENEIPPSRGQRFLSFLKNHKFKIIFTLLAAPVGFLILNGLAAGFVFSSPAIMALLAGNLGLTIGIIAASAVVGAILLPILTFLTSLMLKNTKDTFFFGARTMILAGALGGLTAGFIFAAAPALAAIIVPTLGLPMTIITLIAAAILVSAAAHFVDQLLTGKITPNSEYKSLKLFKLGFRTLLYGGLLGGLVAGVVFGAAPVLGAVLVAKAGTLAAAITSLVVISLIAGFVMSALYASIEASTSRGNHHYIKIERAPEAGIGSTFKNLLCCCFGGSKASKDGLEIIEEKETLTSTTKGCSIFSLCFSCGSDESGIKPTNQHTFTNMEI